MSIHAVHRDIQYELVEVRPREWEWSFAPPSGAKRYGRVRGEYGFALSVVQRAITVWHLMNPRARPEAA